MASAARSTPGPRPALPYPGPAWLFARLFPGALAARLHLGPGFQTAFPAPHVVRSRRPSPVRWSARPIVGTAGCVTGCWPSSTEGVVTWPPRWGLDSRRGSRPSRNSPASYLCRSIPFAGSNGATTRPSSWPAAWAGTWAGRSYRRSCAGEQPHPREPSTRQDGTPTFTGPSPWIGWSHGASRDGLPGSWTTL